VDVGAGGLGWGATTVTGGALVYDAITFSHGSNLVVTIALPLVPAGGAPRPRHRYTAVHPSRGEGSEGTAAGPDVSRVLDATGSWVEGGGVHAYAPARGPDAPGGRPGLPARSLMQRDAVRVAALVGNRRFGRLLGRRHGPRRPSRVAAARAPLAEASEPTADASGPQLSSPRFAGEPLLEACYEDRARMTVGARDTADHEPVSKVQQALIDLGYDLGPTGADGTYGTLTWKAVQAFKRDQALGWESMGDVGPGTMHRLDALFAATPDCADRGVSPDIDPLPQAKLLEEVKRHQPPGHPIPETPLGASFPSFERRPVQVRAISIDGSTCFKCVADWAIPGSFLALVAVGGFVLDEPKRFAVVRAGDSSGCPPSSLPRLLEVREEIEPQALPFIVTAETEHYGDFVRAFQIVAGRYLANVQRLTPERTHLRAATPDECEEKVENFLIESHGRFLNGFTVPFLRNYTSTFAADFTAVYNSPDRDRPGGPHRSRPDPPHERPPTFPNIDRTVNPFGCDAFARKLTARSFPGIPGPSSEQAVSDARAPAKQPWHAL
jgi:hypothetical protein